MERIMNEENDWDHDMEGDAAEDPVVCKCRDDVLQALNEIKTGITTGSSEVSLQLNAACAGVGIHVMTEIRQSVLDGIGQLVEWAQRIAVPIFKGKRDIRNSSCY